MSRGHGSAPVRDIGRGVHNRADSCCHAGVAFDRTFLQVVQLCVGRATTATELLEELKGAAKRDPVPIVPDLTFEAALPWALMKLSKTGWLSSEFSEERNELAYGADDTQAAKAAAGPELNASVRYAFLEEQRAGRKRG